jgi:hypothetical protein
MNTNEVYYDELNQKREILINEINLLKQKTSNGKAEGYIDSEQTPDERLVSLFDGIDNLNTLLTSQEVVQENGRTITRTTVATHHKAKSTSYAKEDLKFISGYKGISQDMRRDMVNENKRNSEVRQNVYTSILEMLKEVNVVSAADVNEYSHNTNFSIIDSSLNRTVRDGLDLEDIVSKCFEDIDFSTITKKYNEEFKSEIVSNLDDEIVLRVTCDEYIFNLIGDIDIDNQEIINRFINKLNCRSEPYKAIAEFINEVRNGVMCFNLFNKRFKVIKNILVICLQRLFSEGYIDNTDLIKKLSNEQHCTSTNQQVEQLTTTLVRRIDILKNNSGLAYLDFKNFIKELFAIFQTERGKQTSMPTEDSEQMPIKQVLKKNVLKPSKPDEMRYRSHYHTEKKYSKPKLTSNISIHLDKLHITDNGPTVESRNRVISLENWSYLLSSNDGERVLDTSMTCDVENESIYYTNITTQNRIKTMNDIKTGKPVHHAKANSEKLSQKYLNSFSFVESESNRVS